MCLRHTGADISDMSDMADMPHYEWVNAEGNSIQDFHKCCKHQCLSHLFTKLNLDDCYFLLVISQNYQHPEYKSYYDLMINTQLTGTNANRNWKVIILTFFCKDSETPQKNCRHGRFLFFQDTSDIVKMCDQWCYFEFKAEKRDSVRKNISQTWSY